MKPNFLLFSDFSYSGNKCQDVSVTAQGRAGRCHSAAQDISRGEGEEQEQKWQEQKPAIFVNFIQYLSSSGKEGTQARQCVWCKEAEEDQEKKRAQSTAVPVCAGAGEEEGQNGTKLEESYATG